MKLARRLGSWLPLMVIAVAAGCTQSTDTLDPEVLTAHREQLLLAEEPDGAVGVVDVREAFAAMDDPAATSDSPPAEVGIEPVSTHTPAVPDTVVVVGQIGGVPNPWKQAQPDYPWTANQAQFVIADAAAAAEIEGHGHAHDDPEHDCPFCASAADSDVVAVVRFMDETGKIIRIDARQLFDLEGDETVVVRGRPEILGDAKDGVLMINADGLYVRR